MPTSGIRVMSIGKKFDLPYEMLTVEKVSNLLGQIAQFQPDVILTSVFSPGALQLAAFDIRKKWIHVPPDAPAEAIIKAIEECYYYGIYYENPNEKANPLISILTGTWNTGDYLRECYESLRGQTYANWEWCVIDDMSTDGTWERLVELSKEDMRVRPFRSGKRIRKVGAVKNLAARMSRGLYLVELDHDDMLVDIALAEVRAAFEANPEVGFVYSNSSNFFENGTFQEFPDPFWKNRYRWVMYHGKRWLEAVNPDIYDRFGPDFRQQFGYFLTVGPHHLRSFRTKTYNEVGGYNPELPIADDFDLYARMFVRSKCYHIDKLLYLYRLRDNWENTTFVANKSIQDHLTLARNFYAGEFEKFNAKRLAEAPATPTDPNKPCFVVASREDADAQLIHEQLKGQDLYVAIGHQSIFEAYETGRKHWAGRRRIVYVHNDVRFSDLGKFVEQVRALPPGLHGLVGSADPEALDKDPWWEQKECNGKWKQRIADGRETIMSFGTPDKAVEVRMLDEILFVAVDQKWDWNVRTTPRLWHGYDYIACKRTLDTGGRIFTLAQPGEPILMHFSWGRTPEYLESMKVVRGLARTETERRDHPNIGEFLPRFEEAARGNVLELGSRDGVSTGAFLKGVEKRGGRVTSIDCDPAWKEVWKGHPQWKFICAFSTEGEKILKEGGPGEIDVLLIDTDHTNQLTQKELALWGPRMRPGGIIFLHDTKQYPEIRAAAEDYSKAHGLSMEFLEESTGLGILRVPGTPAPVAPPCPSGSKGQEGIGGLKPGLTTKEISYVIPVARMSDLLIRCLVSIRKWSPESEIIVVANGCDLAPQVDMIADKVVKLELNTRFGAGCNRGAMEADRPLLCIMNDDAEFVDETPARLVEAVKAHGGFVAPYSDRAKPPQGDIPRERTPDSSQMLDMVVGVCMMVPTGTFRALGGFDTRLDTYEDDDICRRGRDRLGIPSEVVGKTWVRHERHNTFRNLGEDVQKIMWQNGQIFGKKHSGIRVIAIARDEERGIKGFFEQFRKITTDWCLLDTGSTDRTIQIAKEIGVRVESAEFKDFSSARNEARARFADGAAWIIEMDPDERLDENTLDNLKETLFRTEYDIFLAPLWAVHADGSQKQWVAKPFCYRNRPEIKWIFKVHEKLTGSSKQALVSNGRINHMIAFHEDGRREKMGGFYQGLQNTEPYFTDPAFRKKMREDWPILDYDRMDHPKISKVHVGPLISVVIPTFKRSDLLKKAIASVLAQDYANFEIVVVGDACPELGGITGDGRLRVYNLPKNHGSGGAEPRNYGIILSAGKLIAYLDDDNQWTPDHLSSLYAVLQSENAAFAFSSMSVDGKDLKFSVLKPQGIDTSCVLHKKELILRHGWWKDRIRAGYAHDWEFFSRWDGEPRGCTQKPTVIYNADTCGQPEFIRGLAAKANPQ